jgi:hypothetical protein
MKHNQGNARTIPVFRVWFIYTLAGVVSIFSMIALSLSAAGHQSFQSNGTM